MENSTLNNFVDAFYNSALLSFKPRPQEYHYEIDILAYRTSPLAPDITEIAIYDFRDNDEKPFSGSFLVLHYNVKSAAIVKFSKPRNNIRDFLFRENWVRKSEVAVSLEATEIAYHRKLTLDQEYDFIRSSTSYCST